MDCSLQGSSVHGISQARTLEWVAISFSRRSSWPRDRTCGSCRAGGFFTTEPPGKPHEPHRCMDESSLWVKTDVEGHPQEGAIHSRQSHGGALHAGLCTGLPFHLVSWRVTKHPNARANQWGRQIKRQVLSALCIRLGHQGWSFLISTHFPSGFWNGTVAWALEKDACWLIMCINRTGLNNAQGTGKILFLGASMRVLLEKMRIWISRLSVTLSSPMWVGIIQSVYGPGWRKGKFSLSLSSWAGISIFPAVRHQAPDSLAFRLGLDYNTGLPGFPACRQQTVSLPSLHNHCSPFLMEEDAIKSACLRAHSLPWIPGHVQLWAHLAWVATSIG